MYVPLVHPPACPWFVVWAHLCPCDWHGNVSGHILHCPFYSGRVVPHRVVWTKSWPGCCLKGGKEIDGLREKRQMLGCLSLFPFHWKNLPRKFAIILSVNGGGTGFIMTSSRWECPVIRTVHDVNLLQSFEFIQYSKQKIKWGIASEGWRVCWRCINVIIRCPCFIIRQWFRQLRPWCKVEPKKGPTWCKAETHSACAKHNQNEAFGHAKIVDYKSFKYEKLVYFGPLAAAFAHRFSLYRDL